MFIAKYEEFDDYGDYEIIEKEFSSREEAMAFAAERDGDVFDEELNMYIMESGEPVPQEKIDAELAKRAAEQAAEAARLATYGDAVDVDTIAKIVAHFNNYAPLKNYAPAFAARDIWMKYPDFNGSQVSGGRYKIQVKERRYIVSINRETRISPQNVQRVF